MWQFIISGYVPGTDFQVTFEAWTFFVTVLCSAVLLFFILRFSVYGSISFVANQNFTMPNISQPLNTLKSNITTLAKKADKKLKKIYSDSDYLRVIIRLW